MCKILTIIYILVILSSNGSYANEDYKIIIKVNNKIISNYDIKKEIKYLSALNPKILDIPENDILKIAKNSLIREIIQEKKVLEYYVVDYESPELIKLAKNLYVRLNINSEEEFINYLKEYDLNLEDVLKKLAIEANWNALIYQRYKNQISIDKDKIKKDLELQYSNLKKEKIFLLSEIIFTAKNKEEFDDTYQKITDAIKEKNFKSAASIYSLSDTAKFGGEIGWVSKNDISKKIYKQISNLKINEFSKPAKIGAGFILINLDDVKEDKREINLEDKYNNFITLETNRQLNQFSTIYFKKVEKQSYVYEG